MRGDHGQVEVVLAEAIPLWHETGAEWGMASALFLLASAARARGETQRAIGLYHESLVLSARHRLGLSDDIALIGLADMAASLDQPAVAARLLGAADGRYRRLGSQPIGGFRVLYEDVTAKAQAALGEAAFAEAWAAGRAMSIEEVVAEAGALWQPHAAPRAPVPERPTAPGKDRVGARLSPRERQVLRLLAEGLSDRAIAETLSISPRTASGHVTHLLTKLGLDSRTAAVTFALGHGLA